LLIRFLGHLCDLLSATHEPFSTTKNEFFSPNIGGFTASALVRSNCIQKPLWNRNAKRGNRKCELSWLLRLSHPCFPPSQN
jgi:hypothetical protein